MYRSGALCSVRASLLAVLCSVALCCAAPLDLCPLSVLWREPSSRFLGGNALTGPSLSPLAISRNWTRCECAHALPLRLPACSTAPQPHCPSSPTAPLPHCLDASVTACRPQCLPACLPACLSQCLSLAACCVLSRPCITHSQSASTTGTLRRSCPMPAPWPATLPAASWHVWFWVLQISECEQDQGTPPQAGMGELKETHRLVCRAAAAGTVKGDMACARVRICRC